MHRNPWHKLRLEPTTPRSSGLYELLYKNTHSGIMGEGYLPSFSQFVFHTLWCKDEIYGCHGKVPEVFLGEAKTSWLHEHIPLTLMSYTLLDHPSDEKGIKTRRKKIINDQIPCNA